MNLIIFVAIFVDNTSMIIQEKSQILELLSHKILLVQWFPNSIFQAGGAKIIETQILGLHSQILIWWIRARALLLFIFFFFQALYLPLYGSSVQPVLEPQPNPFYKSRFYLNSSIFSSVLMIKADFFSSIKLTGSNRCCF